MLILALPQSLGAFSTPCMVDFFSPKPLNLSQLPSQVHWLPFSYSPAIFTSLNMLSFSKYEPCWNHNLPYYMMNSIQFMPRALSLSLWYSTHVWRKNKTKTKNKKTKTKNNNNNNNKKRVKMAGLLFFSIRRVTRFRPVKWIDHFVKMVDFENPIHASNSFRVIFKIYSCFPYHFCQCLWQLLSVYFDRAQFDDTTYLWHEQLLQMSRNSYFCVLERDKNGHHTIRE